MVKNRRQSRKVHSSDSEIDFTLCQIIEVCVSVQRNTAGFTYESFMEDEVIRGYVAMMFSVIGNHCGMLPAEILNNTSLAETYDFRCIIDHTYYTESFSLDVLWDSLTNDIPRIKKDAEDALERLRSKKIRSYSRRTGSILGRRH